jgi:DNA-binding transcriptional MerR regulator
LEKAPDAFRTISEVADDLDIPQHVLRFWESRFAQIKPMKRAGGRRYYRRDDVDLLRGIRHLLYGEGYTIRGVQRILKEHGGRFVQSVWQAGAEQPQPVAEDFAPEAGLSAPPAQSSTGAERREPPIFRPSSEEAETPAARGEAAAGRTMFSAAAASPDMDPGLTQEKQRQLQAVMADLVECRRLLEASLGRSA